MQSQKTKFLPPVKSTFYTTLKHRVDEYFEENNLSRYADHRMVIKTIVLITLYLAPYGLLLTLTPPFWVSLILWFLMGLGISGIGMSVMHDANHGAYSQNPHINKWLGYTIYLAGAGVTNWKFQHNVLHHTYTNIAGLDEDIRDRGVVKLSPHASTSPVHRLQWLYAFAFYGILTIYWVVLKDFFQYRTFIETGVNRQSKKENSKMLTGLIILKCLYFGFFFAAPLLIGIPFWQLICGFLLMHLTSGLILTVVFQLAHSVEGTSYPVPNCDGKVEKDWAIHQLETTVNFSANNRFLTWFLGGLNYQIEHHLFPKVCHVHYPEISAIVRQTAQEYGLTYLENKSFAGAFRSHIVSLRRFGMPHIDEIIG